MFSLCSANLYQNDGCTNDWNCTNLNAIFGSIFFRLSIYILNQNNNIYLCTWLTLDSQLIIEKFTQLIGRAIFIFSLYSVLPYKIKNVHKCSLHSLIFLSQLVLQKFIFLLVKFNVGLARDIDLRR